MSRRRHAARGSAAGRALLILFLLVVVVGAGAGGIWLWANGGGGGSQRPVTVVVPQGASVTQVAEILDYAGVIRSAVAFRLKVGGGTVIQAGRYSLETNMSPEEALAALRAGPLVDTVKVTIPEGLRVEEVAERMQESLGIDAEAFEKLANGGDLALPPYLPDGSESVEDFLFPKTYDLPRDATPQGAIDVMLAQFETEAAALDWGRAKALGLTPYEVVIVASLIEREAGIEEDRAKIASVIYNRLRDGMLLQIDATVQYALPKHKPVLTYDDYKFPSPYNTYLHQGLPPTPIASPGLASLRAALHPAETGFLFYLVVDPQTRAHGFTETYEEFLRLKDRVQG